MSGRVHSGLRPVRLTREEDLLVAVCPYWRDAANLNAVVTWRDHCRTSFCWINELCASEIPQLTHWLPILDRFDHIAMGLSGTAQVIAEALGRICQEDSGTVDALKFGPLPNPPSRGFDILSIGRRIPLVHGALLDLAARDDLFNAHANTVTAMYPISTCIVAYIAISRSDRKASWWHRAR